MKIFQLIVVMKVKSWRLTNLKKVLLMSCQIISLFMNATYDRYIRYMSERWSNEPSTCFYVDYQLCNTFFLISMNAQTVWLKNNTPGVDQYYP